MVARSKAAKLAALVNVAGLGPWQARYRLEKITVEGRA